MSYGGSGSGSISNNRIRQMINAPLGPLRSNLDSLQQSVEQIIEQGVSALGPPTSDMTMNGFRLIDVADPLDYHDTAHKGYVDA